MELPSHPRTAQNEAMEVRLLVLAGLFVCLYAAALTISPAVTARSSLGPFRWDHWIGVAVWVGVFFWVHREAARFLPGRDPFLLPVFALLSGWGMLTVWSLLPAFGLRQSLWLLVCGAILSAGFRLPADLRFLHRYKYVWLTGSLLLTALTFLFGVNPLGYGPRMWLGCCGLYFQPSEPLKLLLIAYLAAYMADRQSLIALADHLGREEREEQPVIGLANGWMTPLLPLIAPTLVMTGLAIALIGIQRDLGTAVIFLFLYAAIVYMTSRRKRVLVFAGAVTLFSALLGYLIYDVVRIRIDAWLNPWSDPSGRSFQIVQSLLAVANGGIVGRGPGLGSPELVPLSHSDLIFAALIEQTGLIGVIAILTLVALVAGRGLLIALRSPDSYRRYLSAGLTAYLAGQSLLIMGGTLRLFPLTGVTLPFISYGGSSLVVSTLSILLLMIISLPADRRAGRLSDPQPYLHLGMVLGAGVLLVALAAGWWSIYRSPVLLTRTDNPRRTVSDRYVRRGAILDRDGQQISASIGEPGSYLRRVLYPRLSNIVGYTNPLYGQSGLEANLDEYLRGLRGNPFTELIWNKLIYGQPPPGIDLRLAIDLDLQGKADQLMEGQSGALVLMNSLTGEILAMSSHPTFDANRLEDEWQELVNNPGSPLLNRATLGRYPIGELGNLVPGGITELGIYPTPPIRLPTGDSPEDARSGIVPPASYSPLQMALAAAAVSGGGQRPAPQLVTAVNLPGKGWTPLTPLAKPVQTISESAAGQIAQDHAAEGQADWMVLEVVDREGERPITWFLGGVLPGSKSLPLSLALVLESNEQELAQQIGLKMLQPLP